MKVVPYRKQRRLASNEARIITIEKTAIEELLLENLVEHQNSYFDVDDEDNNICVMNLDYQKNVLTYAIMPIKYCFDGYELNFESLYRKFGKTTDSLFTKNKYQTIMLTKEFLKRKTKTGDGSVVPSGKDE